MRIFHTQAVRNGIVPDSEYGLLQVVSAAMCVRRKMRGKSPPEVPGALFAWLLKNPLYLQTNITQADEDAALAWIKRETRGAPTSPTPTSPTNPTSSTKREPNQDAVIYGTLVQWWRVKFGEFSQPKLEVLNRRLKETGREAWSEERWEKAKLEWRSSRK